MVNRYALVDADSRIASVILWDGVSPYDPPDGLRLVPEAEARAAEPPPPEPTADDLARIAAERQAQGIAAIQAHLDSVAQSWGYDDIRSACTYADEPAVPRFQDEGRALRAWRSLVWAAAWQHTDAASVDDILAALPPPPARPAD